MNYKPLMSIPLILLIFGVGYLAYGYMQTGDWFLRSIDLKGGTSINIPGKADSALLEDKIGDARVRQVGGLGGDHILIDIDASRDTKEVLAILKAEGLNVADASIQTVGPALGESFWAQAQIAIVLSFVFMGGVLYFLFRRIVPVINVIFATGSDIVVTLALMQVFSIPLSLAGFGALLMMIGYSVDTDILLDSHMLKRQGSEKDKFKDAFKTGMTMTLTTLASLTVLLLSGLSPVISEIAAILIIGLVVDIINTWIMNAGMLRWYLERGGKK